MEKLGIWNAATAAILKFFLFVYKCSFALVTDVSRVVEKFNVSFR